MGIRVHKAIGYAVKHPDSDTVACLQQGKLSVFLLWLEEHQTEVMQYTAMEHGGNCPLDMSLEMYSLREIIKQGRTYDAHPFCYSEEKDIMLLTDPASTGNYRFDNLIDYYEDSLGVPVDKIQWLKRSCGIFPYTGMVRYRAASRRMMDAYPEWAKRNTLSPSDYNMLVGHWDDKYGPIVCDHTVLSDLRNRWRPVISPVVWAYVLWRDVENSVELVNNLRPAIMTWWD